jgi:DNA-binding NarL/FixJ family response regulator
VERDGTSTPAVADRVGKLTPHEREMRKLAVGLPTSEIAKRLVLTFKAQGELPEPGGSKRQPTGSG